MNTVTVKIESWDEESKSLICRFASDTTASSNPDDHDALAFQPHLMWPDVTDATELKKKIASYGVAICEEIARNESVNADTSLLSMYSGLAGNTITFNTTDLTANT